MGTRGFLGFVVGGVEKIQYVHSDAYPAGLGEDVLWWLRGVLDDSDHTMPSIARVTELAEGLVVVSSYDPPTAEQVKRLRAYADTSVASGDLVNWYVLLRHTQGKPKVILEAGYVEDASKFPLDSVFAEWGYVVDLDEGLFEVYRGFQRAPHEGGRFARRTPTRAGGHAPVRLVASWTFTELPVVGADEFHAALTPRALGEDEEDDDDEA